MSTLSLSTTDNIIVCLQSRKISFDKMGCLENHVFNF